VCIFICEDTRAVHLDLLNSFTTEDFLQAFRRMVMVMARVIHSENQTTFHKAAKVFKASTQRMQLMKIDPNVVEDKLANQVQYKLEIYHGKSQSSWRSLGESLPTTQKATQEDVGKSFPQLHRNDDCPDRHRSNYQLPSSDLCRR